MATIESRAGELPRNLWMAAALGAYACAIAATRTPATAIALSAPLIVVPFVLWTLRKASRWLWCFFFAALLLPPLPIALGDSGPHVAILVAALGLFIGLLRLREWRLSGNLLTFAVAVFLLVLLASSAIAAFYSGLNIAIGSLARVLLFGVSLYVFFYCAYGPGARAGNENVTGASRLYWFGVLSAAFACIDFYYQFPAPAGFGPQFIWLDSGVYRRAQGVFYEASTLGNICAFFLIMIPVALLQRRGERKGPRLGLLLGAPVLCAALILSYSRASLLNLGVALIALVWLERARIRIRRLVTVTAAGIGGGALAAWMFFPEVVHSYWLRLVYSQSYFFSEPGRVLSGRVAAWQQIAAFLTAHPWHAILGIGYKTLPYSDFIGQTTIADNMYLSLLVETGVIGLAAFALLNFAIVRAAWRAARSDSPRASFYGTWMFCFWAGQLVQMLSGDLFTYWRALPLYFFALAMAVR